MNNVLDCYCKEFKEAKNQLILILQSINTCIGSCIIWLVSIQQKSPTQETSNIIKVDCIHNKLLLVPVRSLHVFTFVPSY